MCPICILTAIVLGTGAVSGSGIHLLLEKWREKHGDAFGTECQLFQPGELCAASEPLEELPVDRVA